MDVMTSPAHSRPWPGMLARSALAGLLAAALSFFVSLLVSIAAMLVWSVLVTHVRPDMTIAYRQIAPWVAAVVLPLGFVANLAFEIRRLRRT